MEYSGVMPTDESNPYQTPQFGPPEDNSSTGLPGNTVVITAEIMARGHAIHQKKRSLIVKIVTVVIGLIMISIGVRLWLAGNSYAGALLCGVAVMMMLQMLFIGRRIRRVLEKQLQQMGKSQEYVTYEPAPDYLHISTVDSNVRIKWSDFVKWKEVDGLILAYQHDRYFRVIPVDQLDAETQQAIREHLTRYSARV